MKPKIKIYIGRIKGQLHSVWYDGKIAELSIKDRHVLVIATGEIKIFVHGRMQKRSGIDVITNGHLDDLENLVKNDKGLYKAQDNETIEFWDGNWFELLYRNGDKGDWQEIEDNAGVVDGNYDDAIKVAERTLLDDEFWQ